MLVCLCGALGVIAVSVGCSGGGIGILPRLVGANSDSVASNAHTEGLIGVSAPKSPRKQTPTPMPERFIEEPVQSDPSIYTEPATASTLSPSIAPSSSPSGDLEDQSAR
jgi:hypothetical protein